MATFIIDLLTGKELLLNKTLIASGATGVSAITLTNLGTGVGKVAKYTTNTEGFLRSIEAGQGILVTNNSNEITIDATGGTSSAVFNLYTGTTAPATYVGQTEFNVYSGTTVPANYYNKTEINIYTGATDTRITAIETDVSILNGTWIVSGDTIYNGNTGSTFIGDYKNNNYTEVTTGGTISLHGEATVWNDIFIGISGAKVPVANAPTWTSFIGNLFEYTFAVNDYLNLSASEILHEYNEGSDLETHIHLVTNGLDLTDRTVKYEIEYAISNDGGVFTGTTIISSEFIIPANTPDLTNFNIDIGSISGIGIKFGAMLKTRLKKITSSGTEPSNDSFILMLGVHYEINKLGSNNEISS